MLTACDVSVFVGSIVQMLTTRDGQKAPTRQMSARAGDLLTADDSLVLTAVTAECRSPGRYCVSHRPVSTIEPSLAAAENGGSVRPHGAVMALERGVSLLRVLSGGFLPNGDGWLPAHSPCRRDDTRMACGVTIYQSRLVG